MYCTVYFNIVNTNESSIFAEEDSENHKMIEGSFTEPQNQLDVRLLTVVVWSVGVNQGKRSSSVGLTGLEVVIVV